MNQILATNPEPKKQKSKKVGNVKSGSKDIASVTKFFAIGLIVFGACVIGTGSYALYKGEGRKTSVNVMSKPVISVENVDGDNSTISLKATSDIGIKTVVYDCDKYADTASVIASKRMLNAAGVRYYKYERTGRTITIDM